MIDEADRAAIAIMARLSEELMLYDDPAHFEHWQAIKVLHHAIRHLAYPDRDVFPKVRGSRKGDPLRAVWKFGHIIR